MKLVRFLGVAGLALGVVPQLKAVLPTGPPRRSACKWRSEFVRECRGQRG
jgi:hypothetical protein